MSQLPYRAEYAKSGRAGCKLCKDNIAQGSVRLAVMVKSSFFDGMQPMWYHQNCFFKRTRVKNTDDIAHFQDLRWADQEALKKQIEVSLAGPEPVPEGKGKGKGKGKKRGAAVSTDPNAPTDIGDYTVEYAKSNRSKCKVCEDMIPKGTVRISKKDYEGETAKKYGPVECWHHIDCFLRAREELNFFASGTVLPGFMTLSPEDQKLIKTKIPKMDGGSESIVPVKKPKKEEPDELQELMKKQNEAMFKMQDKLRDLTKRELVELLEHNRQNIPEGEQRILERLSDIMSFGIPQPCPKCNGQLVFSSGTGYRCLGNLSEWTKCEEIYDKPKRTAFVVPDDLKTEYAFLKKYKPKIEDRAFKKISAPTASTNGASSSKANLPLSGVEFMIHKSTMSVDEITDVVKALGGKIVKKFSENVAAVISVPAEVSKPKPVKLIKSASDANIPIVADDIFDSIKPTLTRDEVVQVFKNKAISTWDSDISSKLAYDTVDGGKSVYKTKSSASSSLYKSTLGVQKFKLKGGLFVDPDSNLEHKAHVYQRSGEIFSTVLGLTDVQSDRNSFYKLQVLEADKGNKYWLFRSWGRIGTTIGGTKTQQYATVHDAIKDFKFQFEEKSGNEWDMRDSFEKVAGKMMMLDVALGHGEVGTKLKTDTASKLHKSVQNLITLIFDIEAMKKTMMEFELDLNKMPLGKITQKQIKQAFSLLTELQNLRLDSAERSLIIDRTNRFYTLVPHDFGINNAVILDNDELINQKIEMLNNLLEIEIAYKLLESSDDSEDSPIDVHYEKLKTKIEILDKSSEEFTNIQKYVTNTHAATHSNYKLKIAEVFKIKREGEDSRFKKFKKLDNKMLLWHGSRVTNFAGILSQGLRIAPPEAPATGYMFGKGIYFADMVSKSANYCMTSHSNKTGLLLLCDVALGKMHELKHADYVTKLPAGKHSVKGTGRTQPDMSDTGISPSGSVIPFGKAKMDASMKDSSLLYNEYIVYDVNQVQIQYLVRMEFKY